jgi:hypothetical protein
MRKSKTLAEFFAILNATQFFEELVPGIPSWYYKLKGKNSRNTTMAFSETELGRIREGLETIVAEFESCKK